MRALRMLVVANLAVAAICGCPAGAQCPAVGADTGCGAVITVTDTGASVSLTGQGPYDGNDDTLIGVVNQGSQPVKSLGVRSGLAVFTFDGDGIDTFGIPGNSKDDTGYGGPNAYFTNISADATSGVVNFIVPIAAKGGTAFFSLENAITAATACSSIINNSLTCTISGASSGGNTSTACPGQGPDIDATFVPNPSTGLTVQQAAQYCGFVDFDWVQKITHKADPSIFYARNLGGAFDPTVNGRVNLTSARVPWSDPPQGGGYDYEPAPDFSYPFYYDVATELPGQETDAFTLKFHDAPSDWCLPGGPSANTPDCNNTVQPPGSYTGFTTHLAGVNADGTATDLGIGFTWTSNHNGKTGGIATLKSSQPADPGSGTGGSTVTSVTQITDYQYSGISVTTINGKPACAANSLCLDSGRFVVGATWANQFNGTSGTALPIPSTDSTGFFYFTSPSNFELIVKILNINGAIKVFYGELTDLNFTIKVTDTKNGAVKTYQNTPGDCGAIDENAFTPAAPRKAHRKGSCTPGNGTLCLLNRRFAISSTWTNQFNNTSGQGSPLNLSDQSGLFSFTDPTDVELVMKPVDFGDRTAFFWAALSDFEYDIIVTDTVGGTTKTYHNPAGNYCGGLDNNAFPP